MLFQELNTLVKFLDNKADYNFFKEFYKNEHIDSYIDEMFDKYSSNKVNYITDRNEENFFNHIQDKIKSLNYKG